MADTLTRGQAPAARRNGRTIESDFVFAPRGQIQLSDKGYGVCDSYFWGIRQSAEPWRYAKIFLPLAVTGGAIILPTATSYQGLFQYGTTQEYAQSPAAGFTAGTVASLVETDANNDGATVKINERFYVTQLGTNVERGFALKDGALTTALDETWYSAYDARVREIVGENISITLNFGDEGCVLQAGTLAMWPAHAAMRNNAIVGQNSNIGPGNLVPLRRWIETGARDSEDQVNITLTTGMLNRNITADPVIPIPSGITTILVPVMFWLYGFPVCAPCVPAVCLPNQVDQGANMVLTMIAQATAQGDFDMVKKLVAMLPTGQLPG